MMLMNFIDHTGLFVFIRLLLIQVEFGNVHLLVMLLGIKSWLSFYSHTVFIINIFTICFIFLNNLCICFCADLFNFFYFVLLIF